MNVDTNKRKSDEGKTEEIQKMTHVVTKHIKSLSFMIIRYNHSLHHQRKMLISVLKFEMLKLLSAPEIRAVEYFLYEFQNEQAKDLRCSVFGGQDLVAYYHKQSQSTT